MKSWPVVLGILTALGLAASAQDAASLTAQAKGDLEKAVAELAEVRRTVEAEKLPLARELSALEQRVLDQRAALQKAERFQENQLVELNALKAQVKARGDETKYLDSLLAEYVRAFRSRIQVVEEPRFKPVVERFEQGSTAPDIDPATRFEHKMEVLKASIARVKSAAAGELLDAEVLGPGGRMEKGKAAVVGPIAVFASHDGTTVGLVQQELNKSDPSAFPLSGEFAQGVRQLTQSGSGQIALDSTLGNATKLAALKESLYEKIAKGGLIMIPLIALGLAALGVAFFKWFQLSRVRVATEADLQKVLRHLEDGERAKALAHAHSIPGPAGDLLATAVEHADEKQEYIEEVVYEKMLGARTKLERGLPFLALTATTGPLMGLLGTVMGMIATFKLISSFGSGDPRVLAAGISEALVATATGMIVAIPALLLHAFLTRQAKSIIGSMEQTAVGFINGVPQIEKSQFA